MSKGLSLFEKRRRRNRTALKARAGSRPRLSVHRSGKHIYVQVIDDAQGKTLAVMQVSGGSQSFNAVNQMRILGRWMRLLTIPNQSSVAKAYQEFDEAGRMKPSAYYDRIVDVMEELMKFTLLTRDAVPYLVDRYSERKESAESLSRRVRQGAI